jgi:hypothetical protein
LTAEVTHFNQQDEVDTASYQPIAVSEGNTPTIIEEVVDEQPIPDMDIVNLEPVDSSTSVPVAPEGGAVPIIVDEIDDPVVVEETIEELPSVELQKALDVIEGKEEQI